MPIQVYGGTSSEALDRALKARYKVYKECRDRGETPAVANEFEEALFSFKYTAERLGQELRGPN